MLSQHGRAAVVLIDILSAGTLAFSRHAYEEMAKDNLTENDVRNVLRGELLMRASLSTARGGTARIAVIVVFRAVDHAVVVTAWRYR